MIGNVDWIFLSHSNMSKLFCCCVRPLLPVQMSLAQHLIAELIRQLLLDLLHLSCFAVVTQSSGHFLIGHFFAVPLLDAPAVREDLFVFGGELERALVPVHPPDTVLHVAVSQQVQEKLEQADLLFVAEVDGDVGQSVSEALFVGHLQSPVVFIVRAALGHLRVRRPRIVGDWLLQDVGVRSEVGVQ